MLREENNVGRKSLFSVSWQGVVGGALVVFW